MRSITRTPALAFQLRLSFNPMGQFAIDVARLKQLLQGAHDNLRSTERRSNDTGLELSKERTQFFEKLAIGAGATIAALVSFLGTHVQKLQPTWILRCALLSLVCALLTAMYRNYRYPYYLLAANKRVWIEAQKYLQQCKNDLFQVDRTTISIQTGRPINLQDWSIDFERSNAEVLVLIDDEKDRETSLFGEVQWAERACLVSVGVAMISLVWLALRNF